ncbi:MAG: AAA family ATPase [Pseudomonadota bacterium]
MKTIQPSGNYNPNDYLTFLGLTHNPFPMAPDNTHFYISRHNDTIISKLTQAVFSRKGFMLLAGEVGLGKTTISRRIIQILEQHNIETCLILQSFYQGNDLLREIIKDFGMSTEEIRNELPPLMKLLNDFLLKRNNAGINCAILIDDAQNLTVESLELIRLISNLEADREKLVQILLVGQPELLIKLNSYELRQLKSRVTINQAPIPLHESELGKYIQFKLNRAGDTGKIIIGDKTLKKLFHLSLGNIRRINILMDQALQYACFDQTFTITPAYIKKASKELAFKLSSKNQAHASSWIILFLTLVIIGMISGTGFFYYTSTKKSDLSAQHDKPVTQQVAKAIVPPEPILVPSEVRSTMSMPEEVIFEKNKSLETMPIEKESSVIIAQNQVSDSVSSFLSAYGLTSYGLEFQTALDIKSDSQVLEKLKNQIFDSTGYDLIKLNVLSDTIREKYDILSSVNHKTGQKELYLFWKPVLKIIKFYSGYKGEEISDLQTLLKHKNLYQYNIDGIVGQIIMKSVKDFQRENNLPVTGFPDPETVFLLTHAD